MPKYRKKPVVIDAFKYDPGKPCPDWFEDSTMAAKSDSNGLAHICTLVGIMVVNPGDYIIKGVEGELYSCKPDFFERTYEEVADA
ncbi:hypothetical protein M1L65_07215 [Slackia exigua]|uniref:hypothetical protein n=1 Tax=Slackia exigua TaxID=84109 RepID=UPI003BA171DC